MTDENYHGNRRRPGPPEPRFVIEGDWEDAAAKLIRTPVPPGGVPKPEKRKRRAKGERDGA